MDSRVMVEYNLNEMEFGIWNSAMEFVGALLY